MSSAYGMPTFSRSGLRGHVGHAQRAENANIIMPFEPKVPLGGGCMPICLYLPICQNRKSPIWGGCMGHPPRSPNRQVPRKILAAGNLRKTQKTRQPVSFCSMLAGGEKIDLGSWTLFQKPPKRHLSATQAPPKRHLSATYVPHSMHHIYALCMRFVCAAQF